MRETEKETIIYSCLTMLLFLIVFVGMYIGLILIY